MGGGGLAGSVVVGPFLLKIFSLSCLPGLFVTVSFGWGWCGWQRSALRAGLVVRFCSGKWPTSIGCYSLLPLAFILTLTLFGFLQLSLKLFDTVTLCCTLRIFAGWFGR